jgi:hypothetical protein
MKNVISNYVPILFEKDTLETIRAGRFVRFHGVESIEDFSLGNGVGEGKFTRFVKGGVLAKVEGVVVLRLDVGQEVLEIILSFSLEDSIIGCPSSI